MTPNIGCLPFFKDGYGESAGSVLSAQAKAQPTGPLLPAALAMMSIASQLPSSARFPTVATVWKQSEQMASIVPLELNR